MPLNSEADSGSVWSALRSLLRRSAAIRHSLAVLLACLAAAFQFGLLWLVGTQEDVGAYQFFLSATALSAVWTGRIGGFITLCCSALMKLYFFLPPRGSFHIHSPATFARLLLFLAVGGMISLGGGALYASREELASTLTSIGDAVVATDHNQLVRFMNPVAESLSGWQSDQAVGRTIDEVLHVLDERTLLRLELPMEAALRQGAVGHLAANSMLLSRGGRRVPIEDSISPILGHSRQPRGAIMVFRDVSEQRQTENALRESEGRYRFLADAVPEFIFTTDPQGRWDYCNQRWYDYTGLNIGQSMGRNWVAALHPDDQPTAVAEWGESLLTGNPFEAEYRVRNSQGQYRWFLMRGIPMRDENGGVVRWFGVSTDIEDFKRAQEQLHQALKMEAIGRLAGGVAHDFNNLLTVIISYSKMLSDAAEREGTPSVEPQQILFAAERAAELTRQLLTFTRQQIVQPQVVNLNVIVRESESLLRRLIREDIAVRTVLDPALLHARIDRSQLEQVIVNLAVNARDAMPDGGHLIIETQNVDLDAPYVRGHVTVKPGRYVMLAVSDTGMGMDREMQSRIFEPFFTTKGPGKGTGLGLSVVYGVINQCGGHIWTYSEPGKGTTFKIYLPAVLEAVGDPPGAVPPARPSHRGTETILVLEDEPAVRELVRTILSRNDYTILSAATAEEALRLCREHPGAIHLLLSDVIMPGMSGRHVVEQVLPGRPEMKVLYISGYTSDAIAHHGVLESGVAFLQKPFSADSLLQKVRDVLDG